MTVPLQAMIGMKKVLRIRKEGMISKELTVERKDSVGGGKKGKEINVLRCDLSARVELDLQVPIIWTNNFRFKNNQRHAHHFIFIEEVLKCVWSSVYSISHLWVSAICSALRCKC